MMWLRGTGPMHNILIDLYNREHSMKKPVFWVISILMFMLIFLFLSCSVNEEENRMKDLLNNRCTICHDLDSTENKRLSEVEWREVIEDMISMGTELDDVEKEALIKYLSEEYGV